MVLRLIIILLFLIHLAEQGQAQDPFHIRYGLEDGLPSEEVYDIEQDNKGRIWISTDRGIARYDGYDFTTFTVKEGLAHNTIFEIFKDKDERLWFSGYNGSLTYFEDEQFYIPHEINKKLREQVRAQWVKDLYQLDDSLFIITPSIDKKKDIKANFVININSSTLEKITLPEKEETDLPVHCYPEFNLVKFKDDESRIHQLVIKDKNNFLYCIDRATNNLKENPEFKLSKFYEAPSIVRKVMNGSTVLDYNINSQVESITEYGEKIIVCSWDGLIILELDNNKIKETKILDDNLVTDSKIDREDNLWVSTQNNGVFFFPNSLRVNTLKEPIENGSPTELTVFKDHLFVGYKNGEYMHALDKEMNTVFKITDRNNIYYPYLTVSGDTAFTSNLTRIIYRDDKFKIDIPIDGKYFSHCRSSTLLHDQSILIGNTAISTISGGRLQKLYGQLPQRYCGYQCLNEKIIAGTITGGFIINLISNSDSTLTINKELEITERVNKIIGYNDSIAIIATLGQGLLFYNCNSESISKTIDSQLLSSQVNTCYVDADNNIWVGTNFGLNQLYTSTANGDIQIDSIKKYTIDEGLYSNFIRSITEWNGKMWIACDGGVNCFSPDDFTTTSKRPFIQLDSIKTTDRKVEQLPYTFPHDQNDLTIFYRAVSFKKPKDMKIYRYRLSKDGTRGEYKFTNNTNLQFTNLEPGKYSFEINARNNLDRWSHEPIVFHFKITPHFSQTLVFKLFLFLLTCLFLYLLYKYREKQIIKAAKQQQDLQEAELRTKIAELEALRGQMNPHFVYNALNSIQNFIFKNDPEKANYLLSRFSKLMRSSLNHSKLEYITIERELEFLNNYIELESMRFEERFEHSFTIDKSISKSDKIPPLLIQPLIENAVKHGISSIKNKGKIEINFKKENKYLIISVIDNGIAYNPTSTIPNRSGPSAIEIIKERISIINLVENSDAWFKLNVKTDKEAVVGTIAQIKIPFA